jgi:hypothetical protein
MSSRISNQAFAARLRTDGVWLVEMSSTQLKLSRKFGVKNSKVVSFMLQRQTNGLYFLEPITYEFRSKISHFDYYTEENRWARDKKFFKCIFDTFRRTDTLRFVENAGSFIRINTFNKESNKDILKSQLKEIQYRAWKKR